MLSAARVRLIASTSPTLLDVPAGTAELTVTYTGFADYTQSLTLANGQSTNVQAALKVASNVQNVQVFAGRQGVL